MLVVHPYAGPFCFHHIAPLRVLQIGWAFVEAPASRHQHTNDAQTAYGHFEAHDAMFRTRSTEGAVSPRPEP